MNARTPLVALLATAAVMPAAAQAGAAESPPPQSGTDVGTALVARSTQVPTPRADRPLTAARARRLLRGVLRADGYETAGLRCRRERRRRAQCVIASAQRGGAAWSGGGRVRVGAQATRIAYTLQSPPA
jgi:hypothetical protein